MLEDVTQENGPLQVIPGSHKGPTLSHHNADGVFCGAVDPADPDFDLSKAVTLTGRAGSMTVHHVARPARLGAKHERAGAPHLLL